MMIDFTYTFTVDGITRIVTYDEYLRDDALRRAVNDPRMNSLILGRSLYFYSDEYLRKNSDVMQLFVQTEKMQKECAIQFYAPTNSEQLAFINDQEHDVIAMTDSNRCGKTTCALIKWILGPPPAFRTDPQWPIFRDHGVKWHPYNGPVNLAIASYKENNLRHTIWPLMVRRWMPDEELAQHGKLWKGPGKKSAPSWGHDPHLPLKSGSRVDFYTYEQDQDNYEGGVYKRWLWDEQGKEHLFDAADERTRTVKGMHIFSLTPHRVKGRPDTGWGSWIHKMLNGTRRKGHFVKVYGPCGIKCVPDWIYPESEKKKEIAKWETEPALAKDHKALAEGRARLYGEWHKTSGLVLDEWNAEYSWIDPLWKYPPQMGYTLYRAIDHGLNSPTVCLWLAVDRDGNIFVYRAYYARGRTIGDNAMKIIEASGNARDAVSEYSDPSTGSIMPIYEERYLREQFHKQVMDSRSFALPDASSGKPHGWIYRAMGLMVSPASGKFSAHWVPMVQELLHVDPERVHPVTKEKGAPRLFVFCLPECVPLKNELESYAWEVSKGDPDVDTDKPEKKNDHGPNALGYAVQIPLRYQGDIYASRAEESGKGEKGIAKTVVRDDEDNELGYRRA